jgi:CMP/dCMP kinase
MQKIIIAVDGYSACGKSTTAKAVAKELEYSYIDTGAMYRAVTLYFAEKYIEHTNPKAVAKALEEINISFVFNPKEQTNETYLNGLNVEKEIRKMYISDMVSQVSAIAEVRREMVTLQQKMGRKGGVVMDGRDIGTTVFPNAELKIFVSADINVRSLRRQQELFEKKQLIDFDDVVKNLVMRDEIDSNRKESPLRRADDAVDLDTTYLTIEEQVDFVIHLASSKIVDKTKAFDGH